MGSFETRAIRAGLSSVSFESKLRFRDLEFGGSYVERRTARDVPFPHWEPCGVPRIPDKHLRNVVYLYPTVEAAREGRDAGGSGFVVTIDSSEPGIGYLYAVTNYHVAIGIDGPGNPVVRLNTRDGGHDIIELGPEDWEFDPESGTDIVAAAIKTDETFHDCPSAPMDSFVMPETMKHLDVGPGDGVFMIGCFVDHDGGLTNRPAARFGHISIMPSPLLQEHSGKMADAFCIDMNSRTGYSGSPVWAYRTPGSNLSNFSYDKVQAVLTKDCFLMLLGIHYGQFPEFWKLIDGKVVHENRPGDLDASDKQIRGMSGMTCVLPAWRIREVLDLPKFVKQRADGEAILARRRRNRPASESAA